jgi:hypothetical protein
MAMRPLIIEFLTEEQKQTRERHNASINLAWLGNYLIENQEREMQAVARSARTAYKEPTFDGHHAMPAIIAQDNALYHTHPTPLAQRGWEKISAFMQTEKIEIVELSTQTMVKMSTQIEEEEESAVFTKSMSFQTEDRQENEIVTTGL